MERPQWLEMAHRQEGEAGRNHSLTLAMQKVVGSSPIIRSLSRAACEHDEGPEGGARCR
jgi:hypothetical protein